MVEAMFYLIAALILYTFAILLGVFASRRADTNLVAGITNFVGALIPLATVAVFAAQHRLHGSSRIGIAAAVGGGITIALFVMTLNKSFSSDKVAITTPVVFGGAIILSSILSWWIFKERVSIVQGVGLAVMTVGLGLVIYAKASGR